MSSPADNHGFVEPARQRASARGGAIVLRLALTSCFTFAVVPQVSCQRAQPRAEAANSAGPKGGERAAPAFTPPPTPPGADPEAVLLVSSICAAAHQGPRVGCRSHPPFERPEQRPDGTLPEYAGDPLRFCELKIYRGAFSRPHAKQALLAFEQCEREEVTWDMGQPGSAVLVEETHGRWHAVATQNDVNVEHCLQPRRSDGTLLLFCWSRLTAGPPVGTIDYWFSLDFAKPRPFATTQARVFSNNDLCWALQDPSERLEHGFTALRARGTTMTAGPSGPRLWVRLARVRIPPSPDLESRARVACGRDPHTDERALGFAKLETTLEFELTAERIRALSATRTRLDTWTAESPPDFNALVQTCPPDAPP